MADPAPTPRLHISVWMLGLVSMLVKPLLAAAGSISLIADVTP